ncbi:MAG: lipocalin-like domain-containing protein [Candidatus Paceibacterota bacterium]
MKKEKIYKENFKAIKFPKDEQKHNHTIEWWYFNGNLKNKSGKNFSYMNCLFSAKPKRIGLPFLKNIPIENLFFSHYFVGDNKKYLKKRINPFCIMDENSFTKPLLWANYDNSCLIEETEPFKYRVVNDFVDLSLVSEKKPLLLNKNGFFDLKNKTTYYYTLSRLKTKGMIRIKDKWEEVEGLSWMDHQWAQAPATDNDKWTWFSMHLNNGEDLICFIYGDTIKTSYAGICGKGGETRHTENVIFTPSESPSGNKNSGAKYCLEYNIDIPDFDARLKITPLRRDQEITFGSIEYWEGGIKIKGNIGKEKVEGLGFEEIVKTTKSKKIIAPIWKLLRSRSIMENIKNFSAFSVKTVYFLSKEIIKK